MEAMESCGEMGREGGGSMSASLGMYGDPMRRKFASPVVGGTGGMEGGKGMGAAREKMQRSFAQLFSPSMPELGDGMYLGMGVTATQAEWMAPSGLCGGGGGGGEAREWLMTSQTPLLEDDSVVPDSSRELRNLPGDSPHVWPSPANFDFLSPELGYDVYTTEMYAQANDRKVPGATSSLFDTVTPTATPRVGPSLSSRGMEVPSLDSTPRLGPSRLELCSAPSSSPLEDSLPSASAREWHRLGTTTPQAPSQGPLAPSHQLRFAEPPLQSKQPSMPQAKRISSSTTITTTAITSVAMAVPATVPKTKTSQNKKSLTGSWDHRAPDPRKDNLNRELKKKTREAAIVRWKQKRSERLSGSHIRYKCRKKLADARPRVKGRFIRS